MPTNNKFTNFADQDFFIGLDVHKSSWFVTIRTLGMEIAHFSQKPDPLQLSQYLNSHYRGGHFLSAYEAGFSGTAAHQALWQLGIENKVVHPGDIPQTDKQKKNKTDLHDSRSLARYLESGMLNPIYIMPVDQQERRALYRLREVKVKNVTRYCNQLWGMLYFFGIQIPDQFKSKEYISNYFLNWLHTLQLTTPEGNNVLQQHIKDLIYERQQLLEVTRKLRKAIKDNFHESYSCLLTIPGFGPITSMALLAETGDLRRFDQCPDEYASYIGLVPGERSSGETVYSVHMQPRCNKHLRYLLIEAAWVAIRKCPVLLAYYKKHIQKNNKRAIVKVARKLALIAKAVALNKTTYKADYAIEHTAKAAGKHS